MNAGSIIFLNGTSSAGKTTLAHTLQEKLAEPYIHVALDQFRDGLPAKYRGLNAPKGSTGEQGLNVVPVIDTETPFTAVKFGTQGQKMLKGMRRAMASLAQAGNNVVIDDIILQADFLTDYIEVFKPFDVLFVGVTCPKEVINKRESGRPGRFPGTAQGHFDTCHAHKIYDVVVDTSLMSPTECADKIAEEMHKISQMQNYKTAFKQLLEA